MEELMKKRNIFFGLLVVICFTTCASSTPIKQNVENLSYPAVDIITTKSLGDILLSQGVQTTHPAIEILQDVPTPARGRLGKGIYIGVGQEGSNTIFKPRPSDTLLFNAAGYFFFAQTSDALNVAWRGGFGNLVKGRRVEQNYYKEITTTVESSSDFQQTLIYTGGEGNIIKMTYREFSGNIARPAFTIDVTYDLRDSDVIAFRGARLQILEATNTSIRYKVISNFN